MPINKSHLRSHGKWDINTRMWLKLRGWRGVQGAET